MLEGTGSGRPSWLEKRRQAGDSTLSPSNAPARLIWQRFSPRTELAPCGEDALPGSGSDPYARSASSADSSSCVPRARRSWPVEFELFLSRVFSVSSLGELLGAIHQRCLLIGLSESLARASPILLHCACPWNRRHHRIQLTPRNGVPFGGGSGRAAHRDEASNRPCRYGDRSESVRAAPIHVPEQPVRRGPAMRPRDFGTERLLTHCPAGINTGPDAGSVWNQSRRLSRLRKPACTRMSASGTPGALGHEQGLTTAGADSGFGCEGNGRYQQASRSRDSASPVSRRAELNHIDEFQFGTLVLKCRTAVLKTSTNRHSVAGKARGGVSRFDAFMPGRGFRHTKCRHPAKDLNVRGAFGSRHALKAWPS